MGEQIEKELNRRRRGRKKAHLRTRGPYRKAASVRKRSSA